MNTIPSQEIWRRGIAAVDDLIKTGPVHVIRSNQQKYVILLEDEYRALIEARDDAHVARVQVSLNDLKSGRVKRGSAEALITELDQNS